VGVEHLEDHAGVVIKPTGDGGVDDHVAHVEILESRAEILEKRARGRPVELVDERTRLIARIECFRK
jgi:hypothetical protein